MHWYHAGVCFANKTNLISPYSVLPAITKPDDSPVPTPPTPPTTHDERPDTIPDEPDTQHQQHPITRDEDSESSEDDGDSSDPFRQASYLNDNDGSDYDKGWDLFPRDPADGRLQAPAPAPSIRSSSPASMRTDTSTRRENKEYQRLASNASVKRPLPKPPVVTRTASSSSTDVSLRLGSIDGTATRIPANVDTDTRHLVNRPASKDKKPPPPPKNHHGKLINPPSQTPPAESTKRFSFQASSSESSFPRAPSSPHSSKLPVQSEDYFSPDLSGNENLKPQDTLEHSQPQHKRPPTPPLSRRHSQMRRSKSTLSKTNRLSMPVGMEAASESPPPSPGTSSLTPSSQQASRLNLQTDENMKYTPDHVQAPASPTVEAPGLSRMTSFRRTGQGPSSSVAPPPPPPRRGRHSNENAQPTSTILPGKTEQEDTFPHPSNANHILEDLSRLQREVDALRGQYERKVSQ